MRVIRHRVLYVRVEQRDMKCRVNDGLYVLALRLENHTSNDQGRATIEKGCQHRGVEL